MKTFSTHNAPAAIGPYSQAVEANGFLFTSGQIAIDPKSGELVSGGIEAQAKQVLQNLRAVLAAADLDFSNVVKTTVFMANMKDFAVVNGIYAEFFGENLPARSAVAVKSLPKDALIEIELIAVK